jgi:chromosome partitioning protein
MISIGFVNQKGGVAKSTSCLALAHAFREMKKKVCIIDTDPQAHITYGLGIDGHQLKYSLLELLKGEASLEQVCLEKKGIKVIPSALRLSASEMELSGVAGREYLLKEALESLTGVEIVLVDSGPSLGLLTLNVLTYVEQVFVPCQAEFLALQGLSDLVKTVEVVKKRLNPNLKISGVIVTRYDGRKKLCREVVDTLKQHFGQQLFKTYIRENVALAESVSHAQSIFEYAPKSHGASDYRNLAKEILERQEKNGKKGREKHR